MIQNILVHSNTIWRTVKSEKARIEPDNAVSQAVETIVGRTMIWHNPVVLYVNSKNDKN
jgi:hypothetical protein